MSHYVITSLYYKKPCLIHIYNIVYDGAFSTGTTLEENLSLDIRSPRDLPACSTGETLRLPMSFGSVSPSSDRGVWFMGVVSLQADIPGGDFQRLHFSPQ